MCSSDLGEGSPETCSKCATTQLQELREKLTGSNYKLANLASDFDLPSFDSGGISVEHLKCSIIISTCRLASKFNAISHSDGEGGGASGTINRVIELPCEDVIRDLLIQVCGHLLSLRELQPTGWL